MGYPNERIGYRYARTQSVLVHQLRWDANAFGESWCIRQQFLVLGAHKTGRCGMTSKRISLVVFVLVAALAALNSSQVLGQTGGTGVVVGTITDQTGAAIAGATVNLIDIATSAVRTAITNESGRYDFPNVQPGKYNVTISKTGFRQAKFNNQDVVVGEQRTLDAKMQLGEATQVVEVVASNTDLQTMNATVGNTITGVTLDSLPSIGRDVST